MEEDDRNLPKEPQVIRAGERVQITSGRHGEAGGYPLFRKSGTAQAIRRTQAATERNPLFPADIREF